MGFKDFLRTYVLPPPIPAQGDAAPAVKAMSWGQMWMSGIETYARPYVYSDDASGWMLAAKYNVWAANCIDAREKGVASVGFEVKRATKGEAQDGEDETVAHPVIDLINRANMKLLKTETSFKGASARQLALFGDLYILKVRGGGDKLAEMFILPAHLTRLERDRATGYAIGYTYNGILYPLEDVVRVYYPADDDPWIARSPTSTAIASINRYNLADMAQEWIDRRGGRGGGILSFDASYLNQDVGEFMRQWDAMASDPRNAGRDAALPSGATFASGVLTAMQMQREERNRRLKQEIFAAYHVPPAKAGDYSDASVLANADQQDRHFAVHYQVPELDMLTEYLTVDLLWTEWPETKDQGLYIAPCYDDIPALGEDEKLRGEIEMQKAERMIGMLQGGVMTLNEVREAMELETISDPRADDVFLITSGGAEPEPEGDAEADAPKAAALNQTGLSTIRQVSTSYSKGEIGDEQAVQMLRLAKPDISDAELKALLIPPAPVEPEPEEVPAEPQEPEPTDTAPALEILTAWSEGTISDEAAAVLLREAMPAATDADIAALLTEPEPAEDDEMGEGEDAELEPDENDDDIAAEVDALLQEAGGIAGKSFAVKVVDKDGDGMVYDGTPQERPARPDEMRSARADRASRMVAKSKAKAGSKKKGKAKKSEAQKEKERAEKKAKKDAERITQLQEEERALREALIALQGQDDPSNLRKRISKALDRIAARIESIKSGSSAGTSALLGEAQKMISAKALPIFDFKGQRAIATSDGAELGIIDAIKRQGDHEGLRASPDAPVVIISGKAYAAADVRVVIDG